jgi:uridylate kinase
VRALELDCDLVIKCTNIDGVYTDDPHTNPAATKYTTLSYQEALVKGLKVMDQSAFGMAMENNLTSFVCHIDDLTKCVDGWDHGTLISND